MNYTILIIVGIVGIVIGSVFGMRKNKGLIFGQVKKNKRIKLRFWNF